MRGVHAVLEGLLRERPDAQAVGVTMVMDMGGVVTLHPPHSPSLPPGLSGGISVIGFWESGLACAQDHGARDVVQAPDAAGSDERCLPAVIRTNIQFSDEHL